MLVVAVHIPRKTTLGKVADLCSNCGRLETFRIIDHFIDTEFLGVIPFSSAFMGSSRTCEACKQTTECDSSTYAMIHKLKEPIEFEDLLRDTKPDLAALLRSQQLASKERPVQASPQGDIVEDSVPLMLQTRLAEFEDATNKSIECSPTSKIGFI
jgi:hypothetical protein